MFSKSASTRFNHPITHTSVTKDVKDPTEPKKIHIGVPPLKRPPMRLRSRAILRRRAKEISPKTIDEVPEEKSSVSTKVIPQKQPSPPAPLALKVAANPEEDQASGVQALPHMVQLSDNEESQSDNEELPALPELPTIVVPLLSPEEIADIEEKLFDIPASYNKLCERALTQQEHILGFLSCMSNDNTKVDRSCHMAKEMECFTEEGEKLHSSLEEMKEGQQNAVVSLLFKIRQAANCGEDPENSGPKAVIEAMFKEMEDKFHEHVAVLKERNVKLVQQLNNAKKMSKEDPKVSAKLAELEERNLELSRVVESKEGMSKDHVNLLEGKNTMLLGKVQEATKKHKEQVAYLESRMHVMQHKLNEWEKRAHNNNSLDISDHVDVVRQNTDHEKKIDELTELLAMAKAHIVELDDKVVKLEGQQERNHDQRTRHEHRIAELEASLQSAQNSRLRFPFF